MRRSSVADERAVRAEHDEGERLRLRDGPDGVVGPEGHASDSDRVSATPLGDDLTVVVAGLVVGVGERAVRVRRTGVTGPSADLPVAPRPVEPLWREGDGLGD